MLRVKLIYLILVSSYIVMTKGLADVQLIAKRVWEIFRRDPAGLCQKLVEPLPLGVMV